MQIDKTNLNQQPALRKYGASGDAVVTICQNLEDTGKKIKNLGEYVSLKEERAKAPNAPQPVFDTAKYGDFKCGFFNLYLNGKTAEIFMEIKESQLNKIFMCSITRTASEGGDFDSRAMVGCYPIILKRIGNKIYFYAINTKVRAEKNKEISDVTEESKSDQFIASIDIADENKNNKTVLINIRDFFINQSTIDYCALENKKDKVPYALWKASHFNLNDVNAFEKNIEIESTYIFDASKTKENLGVISHKYNFNLSGLPDDGFKPRPSYCNFGNFTVNYTDYSDFNGYNKKVSYIKRWNIERGGKPIVFWIDKAFPEEYAKAIEEGVLLWNNAFKKIGIENAIEVKYQINDKNCKVGNINYNVISLINNQNENDASNTGPSYADPYTGQIYASDPRMSEDYIAEIWEMAEELHKKGILKTEKDKKKFVLDKIKLSAAHEIGHVLGFSHNFKGSTVDAGGGNIGSIMDYIPPNVEEGKKSGNFWPKDLGPYDYWIAEYTYTTNEKDLQKIVSRSNDPQLAFGDDYDADNAVNTDPLCNRHDLGKDPLNFYKQKIALSKEFWDKIEAYYKQHPEKSYTEFHDDFISGFNAYLEAADIVSKYIGGVYHKRGNIGNLGKDYPVEPVPEEKQKEALKFLMDTFFAPSAFYFKDSLMKKIAANLRKNEDLNVYAIVLFCQKRVLDNLYHPDKLLSIIANKSRGSKFTIEKLFTALREEIWGELKTGENINIYRRNLQQEHISKLIAIHRGTYFIINSDGKQEERKIAADAIAMAGKDLEIIHKDIAELLTKAQNKKVKLEEYVINHLIFVKNKIETEIPGLIYKVCKN